MDIIKIEEITKYKILTILGARPQFIKAGLVSREIAKNKEIDEIIYQKMIVLVQFC